MIYTIHCTIQEPGEEAFEKDLAVEAHNEDRAYESAYQSIEDTYAEGVSADCEITHTYQA